MAKTHIGGQLTSQRRPKISLPAARTHKEYQEFVKNELALRGIEIPFLFQDVFAKLFYLDLSPVSRILKERYSHQDAPARCPEDMLRSSLAMTLLSSHPGIYELYCDEPKENGETT